MTLQRMEATDRQVAAADEIYIAATDRRSGDAVDCSACTRRHERDALVWIQLPWIQRPDNRLEWILGAVCEQCAALEIGAIEQGIYRQLAPSRKTTGWRDGNPTVFYVMDPDFAMDRAS